MDEFSRIEAYLAPLATHPGAFSLKDDAACFTVPEGKKLVVTQDTLVEAVHFIGDEPPAQLAQKALRVNLSDLAAKGAEPFGYFLSLSLPSRCGDAWLEAFCKGLAQDQRRYGITLMGGDSTSNPHAIVLTVTATGTVDSPMRRRNGAQAGDALYVTGTIGDAALGLQIAQGNLAVKEPHAAELVSRYRLPQPRNAFIRAIRAYASACLDVSDGLLQDLSHICRASGIGAHVQLETIPLSSAARDMGENTQALLSLATGGDDYELLFSAPAHCHDALMQEAERCGLRLTAIGQCTDEPCIALTHNGEAVPLPETLGYQHAR